MTPILFNYVLVIYTISCLLFNLIFPLILHTILLNFDFTVTGNARRMYVKVPLYFLCDHLVCFDSIILTLIPF